MTTRSCSANTRASQLRGDTVTWVGGSCGRHGSYIFYKAFRFRMSSKSTQILSTSSVVVRSRARDRRNNQVDYDVTKSGDDKINDESTNRENLADVRILGLGEFFFVQCRPEDPMCVGELQLLWHDKHSGQDLASTRLYYLPETTPAGRTSHHGEDEMLAVSEKIVMRTNDLASWIVEPEEWNYGSPLPLSPHPLNGSSIQPTKNPLHRYSLLRSSVNMTDVKEEKKLLLEANGQCSARCLSETSIKNKNCDQLGNESKSSSSDGESEKEQDQIEGQCKNCVSHHKAQVVLLSLTAYCRHKAVMKRVEGLGCDWLAQPAANQLLAALGAYTTDNPRTRLVFSRDTFDYPQLFEHDLICEELAPVFKGRPRKKTKKANNLVVARSQGKRPTLNGNRTNNISNSERLGDIPDKVDLDDNLSTRRSGRRKNKRRPQFSSYEERFISSVRATKRTRRGSTRTPTPISDSLSEKTNSAATTRSEPSSPSADRSGNRSSDTRVATTNAAGSGTTTKRKSKRRVRRRSTDLSRALQISLRENHKVKSPEAPPASEEKEESKKDSSLSTSSAASSRSSSPSTDLLSNTNANSFAAPSPSNSSTSSSGQSNDPYAQLSPSSSSPIDFSAIMSTVDETNLKRDFDLPTSETNMYLRGLTDGNLPENKAAFLELLHQFMKKRNTPIGRIPSLGFKKLDLWSFFKLSQEYGGYDMVTAKRLWKHVYDRMGGNPSCTSAATCTRKHFEKLLLPLELHLRRAVRSKESDVTQTKPDDITKTSNTEKDNDLSPLNGRTFNGDAYFHNGAKVTNQVSVSSSGDAKTTTTNVTSSTEATCVSVTSTPPTSASYFQTIVHDVVNKEFLATSQSKPSETQSAEVRLRTPTPDLKVNKISNITVTTPRKNDVIDLTDQSASETFPSSATPANPQPPHVPSNKPSPPPVKATPRYSFCSTRTHCPRNSNAPPPFIPTKSSTPQIVRPTTANRPYYPLAPHSGDSDQNKSGSEDRRKNEEVDMATERARLQKRHLAVESDLKQPSVSPKRPRNSPHSTTISPNKRSFDICNLVSNYSDEKKSLPTNKNFPDYREGKYPFINPYDLSRSTKVKTEPERSVRSAFETRVQPPRSSEVRYSMLDRPDDIHSQPRLLDDRKFGDRRGPQFQVRNDDRITQRPSPRPDVTQASKRALSPFSTLPERSTHNKDRTYFRPPGMLATHKASKHQQSSIANDVIKNERLPERSADERQFKRASVPNEVVVNGARNSRTPNKVTQHSGRPLSNSMVLQRPEDAPPSKSFSSTFTVDRLTSENLKRFPSRHSSSISMPRKPDIDKRPHFTPPRLSKPYPNLSSYPDRERLAYSSPEQVSSRSSFNTHGFPVSKIEDGTRSRQERIVKDLNKDIPHNGVTRLSALPNSRSPGQTANSAAVRAMLDSLPSPLAAAIRPHIPAECTPAMLESILSSSKLPSIPLSTGGAPTPPGLTGLALPGRSQLAASHEAAMRQQLASFGAIPQQQQAATHLAMLRNQPVGVFPPCDVAMFNHINRYAAQVLTNPRSLDAVGSIPTTSSVDKFILNPDMVSQLAHIGVGGQTPIDFRSAGLLPAVPQLAQHVTPDMAAFVYQYARR